jgi:hypothetical protein
VLISSDGSGQGGLKSDDKRAYSSSLSLRGGCGTSGWVCWGGRSWLDGECGGEERMGEDEGWGVDGVGDDCGVTGRRRFSSSPVMGGGAAGLGEEDCLEVVELRSRISGPPWSGVRVRYRRREERCRSVRWACLRSRVA